MKVHDTTLNRQDLMDVIKDINPASTPLSEYLSEEKISKFIAEQEWATLNGFQYLKDMETQAVLTAKNKAQDTANKLKEYLENTL